MLPAQGHVGLIVLLRTLLLVNSILAMNLFARYDRTLTALAMMVLLAVVYFGFSRGESNAVTDSRRRARK